MSDNEMRQPPSRCSSSSSISNNPPCTSNSRQPPQSFYYHGKYHPFEYPRNRASFHSAAGPTPHRKEISGNSIFSFLQRFRAKNRSIFEDVNSLPSSPRSSRVSSRAGYRWESVESVLSSATATSFAFIPPYQHQQPSSRVLHKALKPTPAPNTPSSSHQKCAHESSAFLRKKYNLLGSDATLYRHSRESIVGPAASAIAAAAAAKSAKKLHRNSVGNVENLTAHWPVEENYLVNRARPYSEGTDLLHIRRSYCHRPGKRRAPQPPPTTYQSIITKNHRRSNGVRKKRKAPSPPKGTMSDSGEKRLEHTMGAVCNDSLKLERGVLKANKEAVASSATASPETSSVPVSPKPWYKRSATQPNLKSVSKGLEKKKTCEQLLDEWMLEAGLPRSTSFYERKLTEPLVSPGASGESGNPKRRSQISILANISELDREAAEIVQQERKREREIAHSIDDKFYIGSTSITMEQSPIKVPESKGTSKRTTSKDLVSILNAITNVTKITVNSTFFKETLTKTSSSSARNDKSVRVPKSPERQQFDRLTITELEDFDKETRNTPAPGLATSAKPNLPPPETVEKKGIEPVKPQKPFSSWICPQCTLENPSWKFICEACNKWRPYSVNRLSSTASKIILKDDKKLTLVNESTNPVNEIKSVRQKVNDMLSSEPSPTSKAIVAFNDLLQPLPSTTTLEAEVEASFCNSRFCDSIEEVRKARLAFFAKNQLNDLNIVDGEKPKPSNNNNLEAKNKCYSEEDRRKLREILKELKDSLPKSDLLGDKSSKRKVTVHSTKDESKLSKATTNHLEGKKISNIGKCGDSKPKEKAEAYFITKTTIVEDPSTSTKLAVTDASENEKVELKVPVIEHEIRNDGDIRTRMVRVEGIRINNEDLHPVQNKLQPEVNTNDLKLQDMPISTEKCDPNDGTNLTVEWKQSNMATAKDNKNLTSITVNRLLKKLQTAIANGQHHEAANIARDLARLKVNCNMTRQDTPDMPSPVDGIQNISVDIHVHEKHTPRGPIRLKISPQTTINELQTKISQEHGIPVIKQRLIFGKHPITDLSATLDQIGVNSNGMIMFMKVLNSENDEENTGSTENNKSAVDHLIKDRARSSERHTSKLPEIAKESPINNFLKPIVSHTKSATANSEKNENAVNKSPKLIELNLKSDMGKTVDNEIEAEPTHRKQPKCISAEWVCAVCTLINEEKAKICAACGRTRHENSLPSTRDIKLRTLFETKKDIPTQKPTSYHELMDLEKTDLIANVEAFDCAVCITPYNIGEGVVLKDCLHTFCRDCLSQTIEHCAEAEVKCPYRDAEYSCESVLQEREIKALVTTETFEKHLARSVAEAQNKIKNAFHCKTANCRGWCIFEDNVNEFHCPVCSKTNCLTCQVIHFGLNCKQYQEVINKESETNADANRTRLMLQEMLQKGEAMTCPTCEVILMKKWGCDWLRCSMCKTEICWVTRGTRWGPKGKGDTSGGCRCGVNGVKCHQKCTFCH